ncbi:MAG: hypothetical protein KBG28_19020 [Kofleriaceae bacterium]|jgi:hypothetical protein|nr:hypothetical protein [Kofleriaceae bacterium]MBP6837245.1 hypothetical protein [Kofleriaceae bacterium]MBP9206073.1 hypothetical protein [Kofleriaceae bacterium]
MRKPPWPGPRLAAPLPLPRARRATAAPAVVLGLLALAGCGEDAGTRAVCASGGVLNDCPDAELTALDACTRMVECGAIILDNPDGGGDWADCVDRIDRRLAEAEARFIIACISASSCDELGAGYCGAFGEPR